MWHLFFSFFHPNWPHPHPLPLSKVQQGWYGGQGKLRASSSSPRRHNSEQVMPSPGSGKNSRGFEQRGGDRSRGTHPGAVGTEGEEPALLSTTVSSSTQPWGSAPPCTLQKEQCRSTVTYSSSCTSWPRLVPSQHILVCHWEPRTSQISLQSLLSATLQVEV